MENSKSMTATRQRLEKDWESQPDDMQVFWQLSEIVEKLGAYGDLLALFDQGIGRWPRNDDLIMSRCRIQTYLGDFRSASAGYLEILESAPDHAHAICSMIMLGNDHKVGGLKKVESLLASQDIDKTARNRLYYARARLLEKEQRFGEAFETLREANLQRAAIAGMNISAKQRGSAAVIQDLKPDVVDRFSGYGNESERPVFIVGMPRSGTSLTEQILASHPDIHAAGEQLFWGQALTELVTKAPKRDCSMVEAIHSADPQAWKKAGAGYLQKMHEFNTGSSRITDKLPANFGLLPFVRLIFPRARIIHIRRDPLATIASCIRTPFAEPSLAFTVEDWARFYGIYQALMDQWRPILGEQMLEIDYEQLVHDFPAQARSMISFLGLTWDDSCLHPEQNQRAVRTASATQIRRSVHSEAVASWRKYQTQLEALRPLIEESYLSVVAPRIG